MTDFAPLLQPDRGQPAHLLHLVDKTGFDDWIRARPEAVRAAIAAQKFKGKAGEIAILPGPTADDWAAAIGVAEQGALEPWCLAKAASQLPDGLYRLADGVPGRAALGWLLAQHRFDRYLSEPEAPSASVLLTTEVAAIDEQVRLAETTALVRDLVDTPAADMGPAELVDATALLARQFGADLSVVQGEELAQGYPLIAAVGRAAIPARAPRLIELVWGDPSHPRIAIVGKGICFDSGGLDLKPSSAMLLMKKDMGGAAHAIALARLVMGARLPVRLHLLIAAAENAVGSDAFRPGDVLRSRKGLSVEIGNTDAEGRLVLADALVRAAEEDAELILDFATLTGAARVALGPDLPALFANDDSLADDLATAATVHADPLWRLPLWTAYADMLKSSVADVNNAGEGGMAGAITAALFLQKFVPAGTPWAHLDTYAWRSAAKPGRPKGGDALGLRAAFAMLRKRYETTSSA